MWHSDALLGKVWVARTSDPTGALWQASKDDDTVKYGQAVVGILVLGIALMAMLVMFPEIMSLSETVRTQAAQNVGLGCTSDTSGECTITLTSRHEYSTNTFMTVTETDPGSVDRTGQITVQVDRTKLAVTGLNTSPTVYTFTVDYMERNDLLSEGANEFLSRLPLILTIGLIATGLAGSIAAWATIKGGRRRSR